jgi:hypothetical protein
VKGGRISIMQCRAMIVDSGRGCRKHSRRAFLRVTSGALGAWLTLDLSKVAYAAQEARAQEAACEACVALFIEVLVRPGALQ